jgi:DNA-3-methyladenine glycosylase II
MAPATRAASDAALRAPGLSAAKIRTLRAIAAAIDDGSLPIASLAALPADEAHALLTAVKGIGPWTATSSAVLPRPSRRLPAGDLALQEAARVAYGLEARPSAKEFIALAEGWRPWRGVARRCCGRITRLAKAREGAPA